MNILQEIKSCENIQAKRTLLRSLSSQVKELVKDGEYETINQAIIDLHYKRDGHSDFKTIKQWNEAGYRINKGETAFVVWGKPKKAQDKEQTGDTEDEISDFYPLCFLFSNKQVTIRAKKEAA